MAKLPVFRRLELPGGSISIEVQDADTPKSGKVDKKGRGSAAFIGSLNVEKAKKVVASVGDVGDTLAKSFAELFRSLDSLPEGARPTEVTIEFGVGVEAGGGLAIFTAKGDASMSVKATWKPPTK
ncbi:MAG TPA: CU044_2847 family protein [Kofleriaceae bacterium]|nr:CU044_2847 family protein [Kofleriaceae bacterium]